MSEPMIHESVNPSGVAWFHEILTTKMLRKTLSNKTFQAKEDEPSLAFFSESKLMFTHTKLSFARQLYLPDGK
ncbi:MAG: hypothetical protein F6K19_42095 [Cyanothece sp. SIO1E1]|nr:hypothetical protein [Cyanothece sp. SIO1E1]